MKNKDNFICDNKSCGEVIEHIPVSYLKNQRKHFCNISCRHKSEGKVTVKFYMLTPKQKKKYAERRKEIRIKIKSKWNN